MHTIGVDIGGTKIAAGVVDQHGTVLAQLRCPTAADQPAEIENQVIELVTQLRARFSVQAVGVAAAGLVSADRSTVIYAPNIAWRNHPLGERLAAAVGLPVIVENDANAAGWAEYRFGAGRGTGNMIMLTIGTGVGGAFVVNSELVRGAHGIAAEIGHINRVPLGHPCGCGNQGCWEQYASGRALTRQARYAARTDPYRSRALLSLVDGNPDLIDGAHVTQQARHDDPLANELLAGLGTSIGAGLAAMVMALDPSRIVVGGGVATAGHMLLDPAQAALTTALPSSIGTPPIVVAQLGNDGGIIGAADLAHTKTLAAM